MTEKKLSFWSVVSIGVGGMVGGGIFAVLGLAATLAGGGTPVAFLLAGLVALATAYSYAHLSVAFPSRGGSVEFLNRAYGVGLFSGGLNVLLWLSYIVMLSLYAAAFGSYAASFMPPAEQTLARHLFATLIIISLTAVNAVGAQVVGRVEEVVVAAKLGILVIFVILGSLTMDAGRLEPSTWAAPLDLVAGGMIIFLAYEGFELIATTAEDAITPRKNLPRAFFTALGLVIVLYVAVAAVAVGNLAPTKIADARDYALAEAAEPGLGAAGFAMIAVAALLSTSSAINATLYGAARISYVMARERELPNQFGARVWDRPVEGLLITAAITLVVVNAFDISSIAAMGSSGFLVIFIAVNLGNAKLASDTKARRSLSLLAAGLCLAALFALLWEVAQRAPATLAVIVLGVAASYGFEAVYRSLAQRTSRL